MTPQTPNWLRAAVLPLLNIYWIAAFVLTPEHPVVNAGAERIAASALLFVPAVVQVLLLALQVRGGNAGSSLPLWKTKTMPATIACLLSMGLSMFFTYALGLIAAPAVRFWSHATWSATFGVVIFMIILSLDRREHGREPDGHRALTV